MEAVCINTEQVVCPKCNAKRANLEMRGVWFRCWVCNHWWRGEE